MSSHLLQHAEVWDGCVYHALPVVESVNSNFCRDRYRVDKSAKTAIKTLWNISIDIRRGATKLGWCTLGNYVLKCATPSLTELKTSLLACISFLIINNIQSHTLS